MSDAEFMPGDTVMLKSGGPPMTVQEKSARKGYVTCKWFTKTGVLKQDMFRVESLEAYSEDDLFGDETLSEPDCDFNDSLG